MLSNVNYHINIFKFLNNPNSSMGKYSRRQTDNSFTYLTKKKIL